MRSVFFEATKKTLKENKLRTAATLIGVIISVAMITGVLCMSSSVYSFVKNMVKENYGNWSVAVSNMDPEMEEHLKKAGIDFGTAEAVGYASIQGSANPQKPFLFLINIDKNTEEISNLNMIEGRMPKSENEIVIPEHLISNGGISCKIGDEIHLPIGNRIDIHEGGDLTQSNPYDPQSEAFMAREIRSYTVVGICDRLAVEPYMAAGYTAITYENKPLMDSSITYFQEDDFGTVMPIIERYYGDQEDMEGVIYNEELLSLTVDIFSVNSIGIISAMTLLLLLVILFGSYMLMYNTFAISVREKRWQYEIFASVGATESQLRRITLYEGVFYGIISIPLGILLGLGGALVLTNIFGSEMATIVTSDAGAKVEFAVSGGIIVLATIISFIAVYMSITVPAYKAGQTKPIYEVQQEVIDEKTRKERKKVAEVLMKIGGPEMVLANRNFRRYRKHYRYTIISVVMSMVMFATAGAVSIYVENGIAAELGDDKGYDISYESSQGVDAEAAYMILSSTDGVVESAYVLQGQLEVEVGNTSMEYDLYIIDDATFASYLSGSGTDISGYFNPLKPKAVATTNMSVYDPHVGKIVEKEIFDKGQRPLTVQGSINGIQINLDIGRYTGSVPEELVNSVGVPVIMLSESAGRHLLYSSESDAFEGRAVFKSDNPAQTYEAMSRLCTGNGLAKDNLINLQEARDEAGSFLTLIKILSFGFIILMSIIALANVFNTVASNIGTRRVEFASLSAIGATNKSLKKIIYFESLMLGARMLMYAVPLSILGLMFAYSLTNYGSRITGYVFPWGSVIICLGVLAVVVYAIMKYTYHKISKEEASYIFKNQNFYK